MTQKDTMACNKETSSSLYGYNGDCQCSCHGYWKNTIVADINNDGTVYILTTGILCRLTIGIFLMYIFYHIRDITDNEAFLQ